jgi:predicted metal-dependent hydrolase
MSTLRTSRMPICVTPPVNKVMFDGKLQVVRHALGTHTSLSRVQGAKLQAKREIRVTSIFKDLPAAFLRMIVVHELAYLKEREHDRAFYQLCRHMEPDYPQLEFDLQAQCERSCNLRTYKLALIQT